MYKVLKFDILNFTTYNYYCFGNTLIRHKWASVFEIHHIDIKTDLALYLVCFAKYFYFKIVY